jgi:hypothetical protein
MSSPREAPRWKRKRLAIALHTRQLAADIGFMLALGGGWSAPVEPRAKPGLTPYLAE